MSIKNFSISYFLRTVFLLAITILFTSGCTTIDKMLSKSTPSPSPKNSESPSELISEPSKAQNAASESSKAQKNDDSNTEKELDQIVQNKECIPPNKTEYIYGSYKIGWTTASIRHEGFIRMEGRVGQMRIQFFDQATNNTHSVDQTMVLASCTKGLVIIGLNPVVAGTNKKADTYTTDNLIFRRETNGGLTLLNCYQGGCSPIEMEKVSTSN
jgi:hypothetical protein